jgi:serine/threonine protein kinase
MGCSSSTATGILLPEQVCTDIRQLCKQQGIGGFGCFIPKSRISKQIKDIILSDYDIILQYPVELSPQKGGGYTEDRTVLGKLYKHTGVTLTDNNKSMFLDAIMGSSDINGVKVFYQKLKYNTFNSESLRYRELMAGGKEFYTDMTTVRAVTFTPEVVATGKTIPGKYNQPADIISFSIKRKNKSPNQSRSNQIDFILLHTCEPFDRKKQETNIKKPEDLKMLIRTLITDLHQLHKKGIYHQDIKPANIVYCDGRYKYIDYGIATSIPTTFREEKKLDIGIVKAFKETDEAKKQIYLDKKFQELKGSHDYLNPIYKMVYRHYHPPSGTYLSTPPKTTFTLQEIQDLYPYDLSTLDVIPKGAVTFANHYPEYMIQGNNGTNIRFNIIRFLNREKKRLSTGSRAIDLDNEYKFVTNFYRRTDFFSLAVTINEILSNVSYHRKWKRQSIDKYIAGIAKLCDISDDDLDPEKTPYLDKTLLQAFGLTTSRGGRKALNNSYKH